MTETTTIQENENAFLKQNIVNKTKFINSRLYGRLGDCWTASMRYYYKLRKIGAVRMKGKRAFDRLTEEQEKKENRYTKPHYHYWVENKGIVFEEHSGVQQIFKKDEFYNTLDISDIQQAKIGCFFEEELPNGLSEKQKYNISNSSDKALKSTIIMCMKKQGEDIYEGDF